MAATITRFRACGGGGLVIYRHKETNMTHTCPKCGQEFTNLVELVAHMNPAYNECVGHDNDKEASQ